MSSHEEEKKIRLLFLDGDDGTVICRIHDSQCLATLPRLSPNGTIECASRSFLRLKNLIAVRGSRGQSMIGPIDYFGNLEKPHQYAYTICFDNPILFKSHDAWADSSIQLPLAQNQLQLVPCRWESHNKSGSSRDSLFPNTGILHMTQDIINLTSVSSGIDLSSFKARLVRNDKPFQITTEPLAVSDEYRIISYVYEAGYKDYQLEEGSGLFLEHHQFAQTITPANSHCRGFVTLALPGSDIAQNGLYMIAVQIPYGWTLIVEPNCIHGDATLIGTFIMGMTSNHVTMQKADTVFLRHEGKNVDLRLDISHNQMNSKLLIDQHQALVMYKTDSAKYLEDLKKNLSQQSIIFNPLSRGFWRLLPSRLAAKSV